MLMKLLCRWNLCVCASLLKMYTMQTSSTSANYRVGYVQSGVTKSSDAWRNPFQIVLAANPGRPLLLSVDTPELQVAHFATTASHPAAQSRSPKLRCVNHAASRASLLCFWKSEVQLA